MSLPATDNFNRANGSLGSNWTGQVNDPVITSNAASFGGSFGYAFWNADAFPNDQYSQAELGDGNLISQQYCGVTVRAAGTGGSFNNYLLYASATDGYLYKTVSGTGSLLQTFTSAGLDANGVLFKITVEGTTIKAYKAGAQIGTDQTDSSLSSGSAGFGGVVSGATRVDDWEGGSMGGGTTVTPWLHYRQQRARV